MIFTETGRLTDFFHIIGNRYFPTHLLSGSESVLFEAGISCLGPLYIQEVQKILGQTRPRILFLTHMHFDHCGAAGLLKQAWPELKVAASRSAAEIIGRPNALNTIAKLNDATLDWIENVSPGIASTAQFQPFDVDLILEQGDCLDIADGLTVQVMSTPGHTWDSLSFYIPEKKLLMAGEAAGCMSPTGVIFTEFLVDFDAYISSIERLAMLDVDILCQSHHQVLTGKDARTFCQRSIDAAHQFRGRLEELLDEENGQVAKVAERIKSEEYDPHPSPKQPEQAYLLNIQAKVKHLAQKMAL
mgnify:FL=1